MEAAFRKKTRFESKRDVHINHSLQLAACWRKEYIRRKKILQRWDDAVKTGKPRGVLVFFESSMRSAPTREEWLRKALDAAKQELENIKRLRQE